MMVSISSLEIDIVFNYQKPNKTPNLTPNRASLHVNASRPALGRTGSGFGVAGRIAMEYLVA